MEKKNRRMATIFMTCITVAILSGLSCVWVWLLSDHHAPVSRLVATVSAEQRNDAIREQSRAIAARKTFRAMAKAMAEQQAVVSSGAKNMDMLFFKTEKDPQLEQIFLNRLNQMVNSENVSLSTWIDLFQSTQNKDSYVGRTTFETAMDEITRIVEEDEKSFRAMTFDEWNTIYITAPKDSELEKFSIVQMRETVETPDDIWLYQHYSNS
ncbi:MAG: hypothetical protein COU29_02120 [Candidatus Magasanikbacteria bacterium CG10_big_fil_rev_8_21_14_0_10_36_32]|uniref:Uncharacterized protein n=1 Tax=Candidatus Magasanikbacteria bacterium CG10_big_fil_rev_8_21_14_0_10_36_32 TaxID=1974646 RepID=A0A2M6W6Z9_9BACT|nr:MAG: hypothetical protein COU29_02120 [Candidatus Magasanikbacteria bacterium CG10_big_fil_rev_8_21_14_0_10_36_32]